jgi:hypothetical protein
MEAILMPVEQASRFVPRIVRDAEPLLRYRISFADGSVGTRYYLEPLTIGQRILDHGSSAYVISRVDREPEGSIGRASAVLAPS